MEIKEIDDMLSKMAAGISSVPCPLCAASHGVNLSLNAIHSFAISSADWLISPSGDKVFMEIEGEACPGFRERLARFVSTKVFGV